MTDAGPSEATGAAAIHHLPGRSITLRDAVSTSRLIVVAQLVDIGTPSPEAPGQALYSNARARVARTLHGTSPPELVFSYLVQAMPEDIAEEAPQAGTAYILFVTSRPGGHRAIKMLRASEANLDAIRELLPRP